jgi:hypothetical protein
MEEVNSREYAHCFWSSLEIQALGILVLEGFQAGMLEVQLEVH